MYADALSVRAARDAHFAANGFSEAVYRARWARAKLGKLPIVFPNTRSRQRALPLHDLHHLATGFATTLVGEAQIGAWEVAGGCAHYWAAWVLDAGGFAYGLAIAPRAVYRAFIRGRHARNLYHTGWDDRLLELTVGELRRRIEGPAVRVTWRDRLAFASWVALLAAPGVAAAALVALAIRR